MTGEDIPTIEGNFAEVDQAGKFFTLQLRDQQTNVKILYKPDQEQKVLRQKIGYYEKAVVERDGATGEWMLVDLPYNQRPADFPHLKKAGGSGSGRPYTPPRNEKAIMFECALKAMVDLYVGGLGGTVNGKGFELVADSIIAKAVKATEEGIKVAGV